MNVSGFTHSTSALSIMLFISEQDDTQFSFDSISGRELYESHLFRRKCEFQLVKMKLFSVFMHITDSVVTLSVKKQRKNKNKLSIIRIETLEQETYGKYDKAEERKWKKRKKSFSNWKCKQC